MQPAHLCQPTPRGGRVRDFYPSEERRERTVLHPSLETALRIYIALSFQVDKHKKLSLSENLLWGKPGAGVG